MLRGSDTLVQLVGNLLAFAAAGLSVVVEVLQYVMQLGRVSSVDDVLTNALGAALAFRPDAACTRAA